MRQVWLTRKGPPEVLQVREAPDPRPRRGEVRIRVAFSGINFADVAARLGFYPDAPKPPCVVGYEVSGVIDAVGDGVDSGLVGQRVLAMTRFGGYSDQVCVPAPQAIPTPSGMSDQEAAALPVNYLTAHHMLIRLGHLQEEETVLVHGAAGGVGIAAVQLCGVIGARVIGTASTPKHGFLRTLGVEPVDYRDGGWPDRVRELTNGRGVDLALDPVGGSSFRKSYRLLAPGGRLFCFGASAAAAGERPRLLPVLRALLSMPLFHPIALMNTNRAVFGVNLGHLWDETALVRPQLEALIAHASAGRIRPIVDSTYRFTEAPDAHRRLQSRKSVGKVLLQP